MVKSALKLSSTLSEVATHTLERLSERWGQEFIAQIDDNEQCVLALSEFVAETMLRYGEKALTHLRADAGYTVKTIQEQVMAASSEEEVMRVIRLLRHTEMARIASQDLMGKLTLEETLSAHSLLADSLIMAAHDWGQRELSARYGYAYAATEDAQQTQPLWIIGMGKLGGNELNFSSDIDLIFCYESQGQTRNGKREIEHEVYFTKLAHIIVKLLNQVTVDGQAFRVDLRLRPFGQSGPVVTSISAFEDYYQEQGRNWERYAMVKSRIINPEPEIQAQYTKIMRPFVYRRYLDYSAIDGLRKMKLMINQEARRQGESLNVKLGIGGIREIEFIAQVFQLMRGGREPQFQTRSLKEALHACIAAEILEPQDVEDLWSCYGWLRKVEHILQQIKDQQTQRLPNEGIDCERIVVALGLADWSGFLSKYKEVTRFVHTHFLDVIGGEEEMITTEDSEYALLWQDLIEDETAIKVLEESGAQDPQACWQRISDFRQKLRRRSSGPRGRALLADLVPVIIGELVSKADTFEVLQRVFDVLEQVASRTTYLELLYANEGARHQLVSLCAKSPWIAHLLAKFPILLDELIDPLQLFDLPEPSSYRQRVGEYLNRYPSDDPELFMEALRQVKQIFQLHVAAADLSDGIELMKVSDHLTYLAEALTEQVILTAWRQLAEKHGCPPGKSEQDTGFCVIAYGKMGGYELGYGSDLDLVFLCEDDVSGETDGVRPIDSQQFYLRLAQRALHLFTTRTVNGVLYDVDMRLRPSGQSGLMVVRLATYQDYLQSEAWTWEHQALVRARAVFGSTVMQQQFEEIRKEILAKPRDLDVLRQEIKEMREKMRTHSLRQETGKTDVKQAVGGMADIEFITQFLVLGYGHQYTSLMVYSDNIRILEAAKTEGLLTEEQYQALISTYKALRAENHRLALAEKDGLSSGAFAEELAQVQEVWKRLIQTSTL